MKTNYKPDGSVNCGNCKFSKWLFSAGGLTCLHGSDKIPPTGTVAGCGVGETETRDWKQKAKYDAWAEKRKIEDHGYCDDFEAKPNAELCREGGEKNL